MALIAESQETESIDTSTRLITPERVQFRYPLAGPFRRAISYLIDCTVLAVMIVIGWIVSTLLTFGTEAGVGSALALMFVLVWGYGAFCEGFFNGRTIGKRALGLRVVTTQGVPITGSQAMIRNLIGSVDGPLPFVYLPGLISIFLTSKFQRLGDLAAGTMVIVEEARFGAAVARVDAESMGDVLVYLPLRVSAGQEASRALSDYIRHRARFGRDRREEIARHLAEPLRERHSLPATASCDAILCAFYHRLFLGE